MTQKNLQINIFQDSISPIQEIPKSKKHKNNTELSQVMTRN